MKMKNSKAHAKFDKVLGLHHLWSDKEREEVHRKKDSTASKHPGVRHRYDAVHETSRLRPDQWAVGDAHDVGDLLDTVSKRMRKPIDRIYKKR
jgi:hypothetical protein